MNLYLVEQFYEDFFVVRAESEEAARGMVGVSRLADVTLLGSAGKPEILWERFVSPPRSE